LPQSSAIEKEKWQPAPPARFCPVRGLDLRSNQPQTGLATLQNALPFQFGGHFLSTSGGNPEILAGKFAPAHFMRYFFIR
jgi:hypothetical protein